ncbi:hypothetical protein BGK67_21440 [Streptomyces subrutilus]|uniref:Uncharacterized protein n=1 Tax=Streptomyces subrutilus TaxID=36818 RepID=A0A1E5PVK8_9ACTN|nr:hypothetical protein BGK67_21440 [Streptomyces subrutilus]
MANADASGAAASAWTAISAGNGTPRRAGSSTGAAPSSRVPLPTGTTSAAGSRPDPACQISYTYVFVPCRKYG